MREVQLKWNPSSVDISDISEITLVTSLFEVVAHLEVTKEGVRQLVKIKFKPDKGPDNLNQIAYLEVEGPLNPYPMPIQGGEGYVVVWNRHPLSVAAINFDSLHVIPPYVIDENGVQITIRGLPEGVQRLHHGSESGYRLLRLLNPAEPTTASSPKWSLR